MTAPNKQVSEQDDSAHYYFADFEAYTHEEFGYQADRVALFEVLGRPFDFVDLRQPGVRTGVAFVRAYIHPDNLRPLPRNVFHVGQAILGPLTPTMQANVRSRLGIRRDIGTLKDVLRAVLLSEAGGAGKPKPLQPEPDGGLYVVLGDLRVDLNSTAG